MGMSTNIAIALAKLPVGVRLDETKAAQHLLGQVVIARSDVSSVEEVVDKINIRLEEVKHGSDA